MPRNRLKNGRNKYERFIGLPYWMVMKTEISPAYQALSSNARSALIQVTARYNGSNNGLLNISTRTLGDEMNTSKSTAARALAELVESGFLEITEWSTFDVKDRRAASYRITWARCDRSGQLPSKAFTKLFPYRKHSESARKTPIYGPTAEVHGLIGGTNTMNLTRGSNGGATGDTVNG